MNNNNYTHRDDTDNINTRCDGYKYQTIRTEARVEREVTVDYDDDSTVVIQLLRRGSDITMYLSPSEARFVEQRLKELRKDNQ